MRVFAYDKPRGVLDAQADLGLAFVSEGACERLLESKKLPMPEGSENDLHMKTSLALACIAAINPDTLADVVENFDKVSETLKGTEFERFL